MNLKKLICFMILVFPFEAYAGGFLYNLQSGEPTHWENSSNIVLHPEPGTCGDFSNAEMITIIQDVLDTWTSFNEVSFGFSVESSAISEVNVSNFNDAYYGYSLDSSNNAIENDFTNFNPVIFDDDGDIHESLYGCENAGQYLGLTTITNASATTGELTRAAFILNCACFNSEQVLSCDGGTNPCDNGINFDENILRAVFQHEMGHFLNLDHTPLYESLFDDVDTANDDDVPLMYPFLENPDRDVTPKKDDIMALATMYPSSTFEDDYCTLTGTLKDDATSQTELQCGSITAIHETPALSVAFVTGSVAPGLDLNADGDAVDYDEDTQTYETTDNRGAFTLKLTPNEAYQISLESINSNFVGSAQVRPCSNSQIQTCTQSILDECLDGDTDSDCEPCITEQILISSAQFDALYKDACVAGAIIDVGSLTAQNSISLESAVDYNGGQLPNDDDDSGRSSGCSLNSIDANPPTKTQIPILLSFTFLIYYFMRRRQPYFKRNIL